MREVENITHEEHFFSRLHKMSQDLFALKLVSSLHHFNFRLRIKIILSLVFDNFLCKTSYDLSAQVYSHDVARML